MLSIVAIRTVPRCRAYFHRRVAEDKPKMHILIAVGCKLFPVFYAIPNSSILYNPSWEVNNSRFSLALGVYINIIISNTASTTSAEAEIHG
ncbi:MAG: hypothetical protein JW732_07105 [Dehalococcoidia bacterium]|nr:hypothetical protein [Dehalococcoidia bacterium]